MFEISVNRLVLLKRNSVLNKFCFNCLKTNHILSPFVTESRNKRLLHSTNASEIDYLLTKYKLSKISSNCGISYGRKSSLHVFNTIEEFNFESEKDITIETLKQLLDIRKSDSNLLVKNYPNLVEISPKGLQKQVEVLSKEYLMTTEHFLCCPWVLYLPLNFIAERLKPFGRRITTTDDLVLLLLPLTSFENIVKKIKKNNFRKNIFRDFDRKLNLFTQNLNLISEEFCDYFHENCFLFYYEFERLETVMSLLKSAGIQSDVICGDFKIFTHNIDVMNKRINECLKHNMPVKTWMLRSPEEPFKVSLRRHIENKKVLKDYNNNIEYMADQLKCDKDVIHSLKRRYPRIVQISAKKLFEKLSFLFKIGFTPFHIIDTPKILFHSVDTLNQRVRELKKINIQANSPKILTLSEREYQKLLDQLKSSVICVKNN